MLFAVPADVKLSALDRDPLTGERAFGRALIHLLSHEPLFNAARTLSVAGNRGLILIESRDGDAMFRLGLPVGPAFDAAPSVGRWRSVEVARLRPLHDLLTTEGQP